MTDGRGHYSFNQLSGPSSNPEVAPGVSATGTYQVLVRVPQGMKQTGSPAPIQITRGDTYVTGVNVSLVSSKVTPPPGHKP